MEILVILGVSYIVSTYFGTIVGIIAGVFAGFLFNFVPRIIEAHKVISDDHAKKMNTVIKIEILDAADQPLFLVTEMLTNKFVLQATTVDEIAITLVEKFKGRNLFVQLENELSPIFTALQNPILSETK